MKKRLILFFLSSVLILTSFTHHPVSWVAIGDSITYLNDHLDETGGRVTKGYLTDVTRDLPYIHYSNQGRNGWTTRDFARSIDRLGIPRGDVYTVFLGTNDWWQGLHIGSWADFAGAGADSTIYGCFRIILNKLHNLNSAAPVILITPMPRTDFVYINDPQNNAWGSYKGKNGQTLEQVAEAIIDIGRHEHLRVIDLYHDKSLAIPSLVRYKHLRDPLTGSYRNYPYPDYTSIPFHPGADEYPYPPDAMNMTYDGLHPSDIGDARIAQKVVSLMKEL